MKTPNQPEDTEPTLDQRIRFGILAPLVTDMKIKAQREAGSMTIADSSERYGEAVRDVEALIEAEASRREQALLDSLIHVLVQKRQALTEKEGK